MNNEQKKRIAQGKRMIWVSAKFVHIGSEGQKLMNPIKVRVNGTYVKAIHGPIGIAAERQV